VDAFVSAVHVEKALGGCIFDVCGMNHQIYAGET
jgi:hypothetical protein